MLRSISKFSLIGLLLLFTASFWFAHQLYFSPSTLRPILNCSSLPVTIYLDTQWKPISSYGADVWKENQKLWFVGWSLTPPPSPFALDRPIMVSNVTPNTRWSSPVQYVFDYQWHHPTPGQYATLNGAIGNFTMINSGTYFVTWTTLRFFTWGTSQTFVQETWWSYMLVDADVTNLGLEFWWAPCTADTNKPVVNLYPSTSTFPLANINRQDKDSFNYNFVLTDNVGSTSTNVWSGAPDWNGGSNFYPNQDLWNPQLFTQTNQNGIDSGTWTFQMFVTSGWNNYTYAALSTSTYTRTSAGMSLTANGKTWRRDDKNYTGTIDPSVLSWFGVEEKVTFSWYVEDRNQSDIGSTWPTGTPHAGAANRTAFVFSFNQGMRPWFNNTTQGSFAHDTACNFAIQRIQTGLIVTEISWFLHDDWAGIDTSTVEVTFSGWQWNTAISPVYTYPNALLTLTGFTFTTNGCRNENNNPTWDCAWWYDPVNCVCNTGNLLSTGFALTIHNGAVFDPEDPIQVLINYKDAKAKSGRTVSCYWLGEKAPRIVNTWWYSNTFDNAYFANKIVLTNHPQGAQVSPLSLQAQDDWAGVDDTTVNMALSGMKLNGTFDNVLAESIAFANMTNTFVFTLNPSLWDNIWYPAYNDWNGSLINSIAAWQQRNYQIDFSQTDSNDSTFNGYFAPEYPITFALTFNDLNKDPTNGMTVSNPINVSYTNNEAPEFWEYTKATNFPNGTDQLSSSNTPVGNYLTGEMAKLFAWSESRIYPYMTSGWVDVTPYTPVSFKVTDNWAGVDSGTITVRISGTRWGQASSYTFTLTGATWDVAAWAYVLFSGDQKIVLSNFDRGDAWWSNLLNYLWTISNHTVYFDWQTWDDFTNAPVPGKSSRYTIEISASDLKQPTANSTTVTYQRDMENLQCKYLDRCNANLYFTYKYNGALIEPVTNNTGVLPFLGSTIYVVGTTGNNILGTGVWTYYIDCAGWAVLWSPIALTWDIPVVNTPPHPSTYQQSTLYVTDGLFELSGNTLLLK